MPATLTGTNFDILAKATSHSGISLHTVFVSSTQLNLKVTVSSTLATGSYNVNVTNGDGLIAKCAGCLTVTSAAAPTRGVVVRLAGHWAYDLPSWRGSSKTRAAYAAAWVRRSMPSLAKRAET